MLDDTVVNVALPSIQKSLGLFQVSRAGQGAVAGYALTFGAFMLTSGKLRDLSARRHIFVTGLVVFTAAYLACRLATGPDAADRRARDPGLRRGDGGPAALSIITVTFPPRERGMAIGISAGVFALALAISPLTGGVHHRELELDLFIDVPIGLIAIAFAFAFIGVEGPRSSGYPVVRLVQLSAVGLFALSYALIEANNYIRLDADPGLVRDRRCRTGRIRPAGPASAAADARPVAVQEQISAVRTP